MKKSSTRKSSYKDMIKYAISKTKQNPIPVLATMLGMLLIFKSVEMFKIYNTGFWGTMVYIFLMTMLLAKILLKFY